MDYEGALDEFKHVFLEDIRLDKLLQTLLYQSRQRFQYTYGEELRFEVAFVILNCLKKWLHAQNLRFQVTRLGDPLIAIAS